MSLSAWMRIGQPLEPVLDDCDRCLDAWEAGGVRGLVVGRLLFADAEGAHTVPAFEGKPEAYRSRGMQSDTASAPIEPASVLFGLICSLSLRCPNSRPNVYADTSLTSTANTRNSR